MKFRLGLFLLLFVTACSAPPAQVVSPTRTPDPIQVFVDANSSQGTAAAAVATADYFSTQLTATAEAEKRSATQQAMQIQSQATERAWNATATADSIKSTAVASAAAQQAIWTQRAMDITATADTASVQAFATAQYGIARTEELALQRKELVNNVAAIVPWMSLICTFAILAVVFMRWSRVRVIQRDPRGDAPLLLNVVDGVAYDADRSPTSTAGFQREDLKRLPQFSARDHTQTTARDQMVDLATRGLPGGVRNRKQLKEPSGSGSADAALPQIESLDPNSARPLFKDVIPHIVQDTIDAEIISEEEA
jgi:hypothetical protein